LLPEFASLGAGTHIVEPFAATCPERIDIGEQVYIGPGAWLSVVDHHNGRDYEPRLWIGDRASFGPGLVISCIADVSIGPAVLAGPRVFVGDAYHDYRDPAAAVVDQPMSASAPVLIGAGAFLGVHSAILPGVTIGERAYVGANAVVTHDVPANTVVAGNPARVVRSWDPESARWVAGETSAGEPSEVHPGDDADAPSLRERLSQLEQRLAVANRDRLALAGRVSETGTREEQLRAQLAAERAALATANEGLEREREQRRAAEYWLAQLASSVSWRATAPLRGLKRAAGRRHA
jgi:acetyltransferase-like isoleucine patch superfamily enzyme